MVRKKLISELKLVLRQMFSKGFITKTEFDKLNDKIKYEEELETEEGIKDII